MPFPSAVELSLLLRSRSISAREVLASHLERIGARNGELNAIVTLTVDQAIAEASRLDDLAAKGEFAGPLHGIPIAFKDLQETRGVRTTFGSPIYADYVPDFDSETVARIKRAGAIPVGKTNTPEFGAGSQTFNPVFGKTKNPYDLTKTCGGSSGGAAVALATGMISLADGSDTGGSLRNPASFCGVVGIRPTPGVVPIDPDRNPGGVITVNGPMARNCADAALLLSVIGKVEPYQSLDRDFKGTRIAWCGDIPGMPFEPEVRKIVDRRRKDLEALGCIVEDAQPDFAGAEQAFRILRAQEYVTVHGDKLPHYRHLIKETVIGEIERGAKLTASDIEHAHALRKRLLARTAAFHSRFDFFVLPTVQVLPFPIDQPYVTAIAGVAMDSYIDWMRSCYFVSMLGAPALSIPAGLSQTGLPAGMQIVGPPGRDLDVLRLGHAFETLSDSTIMGNGNV